MYKTIPEAIEITRTTYKGREYTMGAYEEFTENGEKMEKLVGTIIGDACTIYAEQLFHDLKNEPITLWPIDDNDIEGMALMETIFAVPMDRAPHFGFETMALDLLNKIVEEGEESDI